MQSVTIFRGVNAFRVQYHTQKRDKMRGSTPKLPIFWYDFGTFQSLKILYSVDTVEMACRQSKIRDCRDTVDDRVSTTALMFAPEVERRSRNFPSP